MKLALAGSVFCAVLTVVLTLHGFDIPGAGIRMSQAADVDGAPLVRRARRVLNESESQNQSVWQVNQAYYEAKWKWENEPRDNGTAEEGEAAAAGGDAGAAAGGDAGGDAAAAGGETAGGEAAPEKKK